MAASSIPSTADFLSAEDVKFTPSTMSQLTALIQDKEAFFADPNAVFAQAKEIVENDMQESHDAMTQRFSTALDGAVAKFGATSPEIAKA
ncbi:MAG: hypothetical protein V4492_02860, partial [Chlamydiota bacterium]